MSVGPLVVLTAVLKESLALSELSVCSAGFEKVYNDMRLSGGGARN